MDLNFNNSNKRRKVQTVQDMLASPVSSQPGMTSQPVQRQQAVSGQPVQRQQAVSGQPIQRQQTMAGQLHAGLQQSVRPSAPSQPVLQQSLRQAAAGQPIQRQPVSGQPAGRQQTASVPPVRGQQPGRSVTLSQSRSKQSAKAPVVIERSFGIDWKEPVNLIYFGILFVCIISTVIINAVSGGVSGSGSGISGKTAKKLYSVRDTLNTMPTVMGLIPELLDNYVAGGTSDTGEQTENSQVTTPDGSTISQEVSDDGTITTTNEPDANGTVTQAGAAMVLDGGQGLSGYTEAASHTELVTQLESALAANDYAFVGMKLAYKDDYGDLKGYPQSVVSHFTEYMSQNSDKRTEFISKISTDTYSAMNDSAYLVVLPVIQFTVNMAYDNTTVSVPGFGDTIVNSGQSAVIKPLLPCMYSVTLSNAMWSAPVTKEIATSLDELSYSLSVS